MATAPIIRSDKDRYLLDFLFRRYYPTLKAAAEKRVGDPHLAEDLAQDALRRAAERDSLTHAKSIRSHIFTVMRHLRHELARLNDTEHAVLQVDSPLSSHAAGLPTIHQHGMTEVECAAELEKLVQLLSGRRAVVFRLSLEGFDRTEIALQLGMSKEAVAQDFMHARMDLSEIMNSHAEPNHANEQ